MARSLREAGTDAARGAVRQVVGGPRTRSRGRRRGAGPILTILVAALVLAVTGAVLSSMAVVQLVPAPTAGLGLSLGNCAQPIAHSAPPGGGNAPQAMMPAPGAQGGSANPNKGGAPVRNPELSAPETFEQLNEIQLRNAKAVVQAARAAGANDKAVVMALMAAMVETRLYNLASDAPGQEDSLNHPNDGVSVDNLSVGMFQQLPEQGTPAERIDIAKTTTMFIRGTHDRGRNVPGLFDIKDWETRPAGEVVQAVQVSAFGGRYAQFEEFGQKLLAKITAEGGAGIAPLSTVPMGCGPSAYSGFGPPPPWLASMLAGVQPDTMLVAGAVASKFPQIKVYGGVRPDSLPDHPSGRAVDIMISSAVPDFKSPAGVDLGNQVAKLVQDNAAALGVDYIIWNEHIWSVARAGEGWRQCGSGGGCYNGPDDTAAHRDHVHVTTFGNSGKGLPQPAAMPAGSGKAVAPLPPEFRPAGRFGATGPMWSSRHTGEDFPAPLGTPIHAVMDGVVGEQIPQGWNGNHVVIGHPGGIHTHYAHMSTTTVQPGQQVRAGDVIGTVGSTGNSSGPHLHLEYYPPGIRPGDVYKAQDPVAFLKANGVSY